MTVLTEGKHRAEFIASEANGTRSRDVVTLAEGQNLGPGTVLGRITASGLFTQLDPEAETGAEVASAILYDHVDASDADTSATVIARDAEVADHSLVWPEGISAGDKADAIAALADTYANGFGRIIVLD
ncbi:hypothetical protein J2T57_002601 [Natronocella acetinitrilica]|uniref:Head decoration protein n=1 Tax=Natronocella acetinitrilica TaxID=414046 RepID=A0AAE3G459_9GAMM|nr:head decoration protein [Natronocella acetinitrilica]MCP1675451.1 hypothetical protein [Natronocella acetinitrilica]